MGVLVFAQVETETYIPLYERHVHGSELVEAERQQFGCDHAELGARLLSRWNLPAPLTSAVAHHHQAEEKEDADLDATVRAADLVAHLLCTRESDRLPAAQQLLSGRFKLDLDDFINLALDCKHRVAQYAELFQVELTDSIDCDALLAEARKLYETEALKAAMDLDSLTSVVDQD